MELPVACVPVDKSLNVQRDASSGEVLGDGVVVTWGVSGATISFGHPVLVKFNVNASTSTSCRVNVAVIIAEGVCLSVSIPVRVGSTSVDGVVGCGTVTVSQVWQVNSVNLDECRNLLAVYVGDRAGWR